MTASVVQKSPVVKSIILMLIGLVGYACNVVYTRILTHNLSLDLYGDFSVAWCSLMLVDQLITFGVGLSAQRFVSLYTKKHQPAKTRAFLYWGASILLRSSIVLAIAYILFWIVASITHFTEIHRFDQYHLALFVIIFAPMMSIAVIITRLIQSSGHTILSTVVATLVNRIVQIVIILFFLELFIPKEVYHLSLILVSILFCTMLVNALIYSWITENDILNTLKPTKSRFVDKDWLAVAQSSCLNGIMFTLTVTSDLLILEFFSPYENHVGIFSVCGVCVGLLSTLQASINSQSTAAIMNINLMKPKERSILQKSLDAFNAIKLMLVCISIFSSWIFRQEIFSFFNIHSDAAHLLLPLMFFNVYLLDYRYQFDYLVANKEMAFVNRVQGISTAAMIIGSLILVMPYNMFGIASATLLSRVYAKVMMTIRCRRHSAMRFALFA